MDIYSIARSLHDEIWTNYDNMDESIMLSTYFDKQDDSQNDKYIELYWTLDGEKQEEYVDIMNTTAGITISHNLPLKLNIVVDTHDDIVTAAKNIVLNIRCSICPMCNVYKQRITELTSTAFDIL